MNKKIKTAIIPAAGLGTRFLPITKCVPKELIPLVDRPCLQHVIDEALAAGVEEFIFVISEEKRSLENYFITNPRLNTWLSKRHQSHYLEILKQIETRAEYRFVIQDEPLGLGHAVLCAREFVNDDFFFVILPDDIVSSETPVCAQMLKEFSENMLPMLAVMLVDWEHVNRYGIVGAAPLTDSVGDVQTIVEKPKREESPSNLAVIGRYILPQNVFDILAKTTPGAGGEIQLTDALRTLISQGGLQSLAFAGERFDTGTPLGWLKANAALALKSPEYRDEWREYLKVLAVSL